MENEGGRFFKKELNNIKDYKNRRQFEQGTHEQFINVVYTRDECIGEIHLIDFGSN